MNRRKEGPLRQAEIDLLLDAIKGGDIRPEHEAEYQWIRFKAYLRVGVAKIVLFARDVLASALGFLIALLILKLIGGQS